MSKKEPLPVPPWHTDVKVVYAGDMFIELEGGSTKAEVSWDGSWYCSYDSRKDIKDYMKLDRRLTEKIQADLASTYEGGGWAEWRKAWLKSETFPVGARGPKDWHPKGKREPLGKVYGPRSGGYGSDNTTNMDSAYWWGDTFEYTHFLTTDGDEEGAIIMWHLGGDVRGNYSNAEVWMGDFGEFMGSQKESDPESPDSFLHWNRSFDGLLLWAMDELGLFEGKVNWVGSPREPVSHEPPKQIVRAFLMADGDDSAMEQLHLYPSLIEKIMAHADILPKEIVITAGREFDRARREMEEGQGQQYLWEPPE